MLRDRAVGPHPVVLFAACSVAAPLLLTLWGRAGCPSCGKALHFLACSWEMKRGRKGQQSDADLGRGGSWQKTSKKAKTDKVAKDAADEDEEELEEWRARVESARPRWCL